VTRAIRYAIASIGEHHPLLGEHLNRAIRTGTYCGYLPDPRAVVAWKLSPPGAASSGIETSSPASDARLQRRPASDDAAVQPRRSSDS
jgi:hypothetical protein